MLGGGGPGEVQRVQPEHAPAPEVVGPGDRDGAVVGDDDPRVARVVVVRRAPHPREALARGPRDELAVVAGEPGRVLAAGGEAGGPVGLARQLCDRPGLEVLGHRRLAVHRRLVLVVGGVAVQRQRDPARRGASVDVAAGDARPAEEQGRRRPRALALQPALHHHGARVGHPDRDRSRAGHGEDLRLQEAVLGRRARRRVGGAAEGGEQDGGERRGGHGGDSGRRESTGECAQRDLRGGCAWKDANPPPPVVRHVVTDP